MPIPPPPKGWTKTEASWRREVSTWPTTHPDESFLIVEKEDSRLLYLITLLKHAEYPNNPVIPACLALMIEEAHNRWLPCDDL